MKQLLAFVRKEFYHVFRDRRTLLIMFGLPLAQILLFGFALTTEVRNADILVIDHAGDVQSARLTNKIEASDYFTLQSHIADYRELENACKKGMIKCALIFPAGFGSDLLGKGEASVQIITDGSDPNTAKTITSYLTAIITDYQKNLTPSAMPRYQIIPETRMLYNEEGNGSLNFIPGVMALILMLVCTALTSVSIVKEKELGTMEVLLVSPFKPVMVLISKAIPYLA